MQTNTDDDSEHEEPPKKKPKPDVCPSVQQASGDKRELCKNERLIGADPGFQYDKYYFPGQDQGPNTQWESTDTCQGVTENQLHKDACPSEQNILIVCHQFAGGKPAYVWLSETLPWDLGLPMTTLPPQDPHFLQAFILCKGRPPVLLSLYGKGGDVNSVQDYTKETARLLHWSVLDYCHLNFSVLPCSMTLADIEQEQSLEKNVQEVLDAVEFYMKRSLALDGEMLCQLREATRALTGATFLRLFLTKDKTSVFLMGKKQRDAVSLAIEECHKTGRYEVQYPSDKPVSDESIVALEVAKRISFTKEVQVSCTDGNVLSCLKKIKDHTKDQVDISLRLNGGQFHLECDGKQQAHVLVELPAKKPYPCHPLAQKRQNKATIPKAEERQVLMQSMYKMIVDGELSELCQHPSLQSPGFMQDFDDFVRGHNYMQQVVSAVDREHGLPLLYWSAWSFSPHLTHWCLAVMDSRVETGPRLSGGLLRALMATLLFANFDSDSRSVIKSLLTRFRLRDGKLASTEILKLSLPLPSKFPTQIMVNFREHGLCYLDDPSLPIPATLLSVTVTEDAVSVELPSQHWYLALRLLADREVDETDGDGSTLLHIAADKGSKDIVELLLSHKADVNVLDSYGNSPLHKACSTGRHDIVELLLSHKAVMNVHDKDGDTPLHKACSEGSKDMVELLLSHKADVNVHDGYGNTPLHTACSTGSKEMVELLLSHKADVNVQDKKGNTPLHKACSEGQKDTSELSLLHRTQPKWYGRDKPLDQTSSGYYRDTIELSLSHGADVNAQDEYGYTPLHRTSSRGQREMVKLLLRHKADVNVQGKDGNTPTITARRIGHDDIHKLLMHPEAAGTEQDKDDTTQSYECNRVKGQKRAFEQLLHHDADVLVHDQDGKALSN